MTRIELPLDNFSNTEIQPVIGDCLFLTGELKMDLATDVSKQLLQIEHRNAEFNNYRKVSLIINSPGGDLYSAWMICDIMDQMITPVETIGLGEVASGGFLIFMNGTKGLRKATMNTQFMSHRYSIGIQASHADLMAQRDELDKTHDRIVNHYIKCTGLKKTKVEKELLTEHNVWLDAEQCKHLNICDEVIIKPNYNKKGNYINE